MAIQSQYITDKKLNEILNEQNIQGYGEERKQDLIDRAVGDLESGICERYVVPLINADSGEYSTTPKFAQQKVLNAVISRIRGLIGNDQMRNLVIESTQKYVDVHAADFAKHIKELLDAKKHFGFKLNDASDGAYDPVQSLGLARADNRTRIIPDKDFPQF